MNKTTSTYIRNINSTVPEKCELEMGGNFLAYGR